MYHFRNFKGGDITLKLSALIKNLYQTINIMLSTLWKHFSFSHILFIATKGVKTHVKYKYKPKREEKCMEDIVFVIELIHNQWKQHNSFQKRGYEIMDKMLHKHRMIYTYFQNSVFIVHLIFVEFFKKTYPLVLKNCTF